MGSQSRTQLRTELICVCVTDSLRYTAEANTTLQINYTPIKISLKRESWLGALLPQILLPSPRPLFHFHVTKAEQIPASPLLFRNSLLFSTQWWDRGIMSSYEKWVFSGE